MLNNGCVSSGKNLVWAISWKDVGSWYFLRDVGV